MIDLGEQLAVVSTPPPLPVGWQLEVAHQVAGKAPFGGDCLVPALTRNGEWLELVLVDIAGKGLQAGIRALMLAGAINGLLGVVPVAETLAAVNTHVCRQGWTDGLVTAIHAAVELRTGALHLTVAGHPPAARYRAGTGRWLLSGDGGPALGIMEDGQWPTETALLRPGDALLLYTDGLVEQRHADLSVGIDRMLGQADRLVMDGFRGGAGKLLAAAAGRSHDDCEVVLLWRM